MQRPKPTTASTRRIPLLVVLTLTCMVVVSKETRAIDIFDRHDSLVLKQVVEVGTALKEISLQQAARLQPLDKKLEGSCLIVLTNRGNLAKVLVSWGFRKQRADGPPIPVVMLDRFVTYERDKRDSTVANGKNVMLFPGFQFDFDLGQVVPVGFDADLEFNDKGILKTLDSVQMFGVNGSQLPRAEAVAPGKKPSEIIVPEDFSGAWQVDGDGRWIGEWDLAVNEEGIATGKFLSAETQASYPMTGQVGGVSNQIKLQVEFNSATQVVEAYLWTKDKSKIAGTFSMAGRKFGVMATRVPPK